MPRQNSGYINVDELMPQVTLEQAAAFYGLALPEFRRIGEETRAQCFLNCRKQQPTGDRALAIQAEHPVRQWVCHQYGCGCSGNLVSLCDLMKPGENAGGRPRGDRFKQIAADLRAMVQGFPSAQPSTVAPSPTVLPAPPPPKVNLPLARSDNERARGLADLDDKFITDPAAMPPAAASYFRRRPFLSSEVCRKWRVGYLPRDVGGEDKQGGTMRGKVVYAYLSEQGEVLTWFGRDPEFEEKHRNWLACGREGREPEKFHFVKGFHRGLELFGQNGRERLAQPGYRDQLRKIGLVVVEGPNDILALDSLGVPAVALCSNMVTSEQAAKIARWAYALAGGVVTLMLDCDPEGENGARQAVWELSQRCQVQLAWSPTMFGGKFKGRQPESLSAEDWEQLCAKLTS